MTNEYKARILKMAADLKAQGKQPRGDLREALIEIQLAELDAKGKEI